MRRVFGLNDPADRANEMSETLAIFYNLKNGINHFFPGENSVSCWLQTTCASTGNLAFPH